MYIIVKYGKNESLICNPSCAVVNLLSSIKQRAGFPDLTIDLSDETGLVKELDDHKGENANSLLTGHNTYILLKKDPLPQDGATGSRPSTASTTTTTATSNTLAPGGPSSSSAPSPNTAYTYTALLEQIEELFPQFKIHVAELEDSKQVKKMGPKTPSPAGRLVSKHKKRTSGIRRK